MRWPWVARDSHDETVKLLQEQIADMRAERKVIYDRLGALGLGGPLFHLPTPEEQPAAEEELTEEEQEQIYIRSLRPSQRAHYLERKMKRDLNKINRGPDVAFITPEPQQVARVTEAFEAGRPGRTIRRRLRKACT